MSFVSRKELEEAYLEARTERNELEEERDQLKIQLEKAENEIASLKKEIEHWKSGDHEKYGWI